MAEYTDAGIAALDGITAADEEHKSFLQGIVNVLSGTGEIKRMIL